MFTNRASRYVGMTKALTVAIAALVTSANTAGATAPPPPSSRLAGHLWNYQNDVFRPYVHGVRLSGGHTTVAGGKSRLTGATANVRSSLRDQPPFAKAARAICLAAADVVQKLHLSMVSAVQVWSVDGHPVARC